MIAVHQPVCESESRTTSDFSAERPILLTGGPFSAKCPNSSLKNSRGVSVGTFNKWKQENNTSYLSKKSAANFIHFIAQSQRQRFIEDTMTSCNFYSFLMDGSTDAGNIDNEVIAVLYCQRDSKAAEIKSYVRYFSTQAPTETTHHGLVKCVGNALKSLGVQDIDSCKSVLHTGDLPVLVGGEGGH